MNSTNNTNTIKAIKEYFETIRCKLSDILDNIDNYYIEKAFDTWKC